MLSVSRLFSIILIIAIGFTGCSSNEKSSNEKTISKYIEDVTKTDSSIGQKVFLFDENECSIKVKDSQNHLITRFKISEVDFDYVGRVNEFWLHVVQIKCQNNNQCLKRKMTHGHSRWNSNWKINLSEESYRLESSQVGNNLVVALNALKNICNNQPIGNEQKLNSILNKKDPDALNKSLYSAVANNNKELVKKLLSDGADINYISKSGTGLLHIAFGNLELSRLLLDMGINVNQKNKRGSTPLHYTVAYNSTAKEGLPSAKIYLSYGAKTNIRDNDGETVIELSKRLRNKELLQLITGSSMLFDIGKHIYMCGNKEVCEAVILSPGKNKSKIEFTTYCNPGLITSFSAGQTEWIENKYLSYTPCK